MLRLERTCGTHDVPAESDFRNSFSCDNVCLDCVGEVKPSIQVLVRLEIEIVVRTPKFGVVVGFRKEPRGPQDDAWQALRPEEQLTKILGRFLCDPVDVPRNRFHVLVDPNGGLPLGRSQRSPEGTRRAAKDDAADAASKCSFENRERSRDVGLDEGVARVR